MTSINPDMYSSADDYVDAVFKSIETIPLEEQVTELKKTVVYFKNLTTQFHTSNNLLYKAVTEAVDYLANKEKQ